MTTTLSERLPIWEVAGNHIVSKMGDTTRAFVLVKREVFTLSGEELRALHQAWVKAIEVLLPNTIVHIQDWYWEDHWSSEGESTGGGFLDHASNRHFHERPWLNHACYLYITRRPAKRVIPAGKALLQRQLIPPDTLLPAFMESFDSTVEQFVRILSDSGLIECQSLENDELVSFPGKPGLIERYCQLVMPGEPIVSRDIDLDKGIGIGERACVLHTLADAERLPAQCSPGQAYIPYSQDGQPFPIGFGSTLGLLLPCNHIYNQYIVIDDTEITRKHLEQKARRMESLATHSRANALGKAAVDAFLQDAIAGQKKMVKAHFNVLAWTDEANDLGELRHMVGSAIARMGAVPHEETISAAQVWCAGIPGNAADLPPYELFDSLAEQAACFLIPDTNFRASISTTGIRLGDRLRGRPLQLDLSDGPMRSGLIKNRNKFVLGGSGSGKSFFTNHLIRHYYEQGAHIVIVDIGNSYQGLCGLVDGYYFTYSEQDPLRFNPFKTEDGDVPDLEKRESLKTLLLALWKKEDEAFLRSEYVALSNALQLYYDMLASKPAIFPCFNSWYEFLRDEFTQVLAEDRVKARDFDIDNFLYVLRPYYRGGEYDYLLNASENLDLFRQRMIVFELDVLKDHPILFPVVTIVIMEVFISKMRKLPGIRKVILIEEAWKAIARQGMSEYIKYLFKTVRKFYGEAIVVSQEVDDIISSPIVRQAIVNSSDCKVLLDQSKFRNRFDEIQQCLGLTDKDKALVLSLNKNNDPAFRYKEVFISLGSQYSQVYRVEVSLEEYLVYTTEEPEKLRVQEYARKYGGIQNGVKALAAGIRDGSVKWVIYGVLLLMGMLSPPAARAQFDIGSIIGAAIKKVIVATDLAIQRMQTETIVAQDEQRQLENEMQSDELGGITEWVRRQKELYAQYYDELWTAKQAIALYTKVGELIRQEAGLVSEYQQAWKAIARDGHFSAAELGRMADVYGRILTDAGERVDLLRRVITNGVTQMEDGGRLGIVDRLAAAVAGDRQAFRSYTEQNILLSLQRSKDLGELQFIKSIYGIH